MASKIKKIAGISETVPLRLKNPEICGYINTILKPIFRFFKIAKIRKRMAGISETLYLESI